MATVTFKILTNSDWNSIYIRFRQGNQFDYPYSTGIKVPKGRWSKTKQIVLPTKEVNSDEINSKLRELKIFILKEFENSKLKGTTIRKEWIKEKVSVFLNKKTLKKEIDDKIFFTDFVDSFIESSKERKTRRGNLVENRTIQHYNTTNNKVRALEKHLNTKFKLTDIDLDFHSRFIDFLSEAQHLRNSTIGGYVDDIRLFCRTADKMQYEVSPAYKFNEFYSPSYETDDIYLNTDEIAQIHKTDINNEKLNNAKDWLVIGLCSGLRVSDLLNLSTKNINKNRIYIKTKKTKYPVIIPIHKFTKEILIKRDGKFPRKISDQKFNDYIKEVCKLAGIDDLVEGARMCPLEIEVNGKKKIIHRKKNGTYPKYELVSSHICIRSFASNLYDKLDTSVIMRITGHKSESQFLKYIKITSEQYADKLENYWQKNEYLFE